MRRAAGVAALLAILSVSARTAPQPPSLDQILARGAEYVGRHIEVMSNLVAEERYEQEIVRVPSLQIGRMMPGRVAGIMTPVGNARRVLRSDVELINVGPPVGWRSYRDVFEVDGKPVRDRSDRLAKLLLQPAASAREQANRIAAESARFNISDLGRTLNEPGLPIMFLQTALQPRFEFRLDKHDRGTVWILKYVERARPTLFQHNYVEDNPSSGRLWIDAATGEVTKTEQIVSPGDMAATFTTDFREDKKFSVALPTQMHEELKASIQDGVQRVQGTAKYTHFRRFQVTTGVDIR
jgi:hypothetical protein